MQGIEKTLIHLLFESKLNIHADKWDIAIIEQDIPCGNLAIKDFIELINSLLKLESKTDKLPNTNVFVENNARFASAAFYSSNNIDRNKKYDLLIDISVLQRRGLTKINANIQADAKVLTYSAHSPKIKRNFRFQNILIYV